MIPFAAFEPDRSQYALDASTVITNAVPVADGWGPLPDLTVISTALAATCLGAVYIRTNAGAYRIIAGTATKLYEFNSATLGWTDRTRLVGGNYAVPSGDNWSFEVYGANLIACNLADDPQFLGIESGTNFALLAGSPPKAKYVWTSGEFLVLGHLAGFPNRIETSGIGDATYWTVGERGCDYQDFPNGEEIMGGIGSERGGVIFQRTMIRQMAIANSGDYSFSTAILNPNRGVIAPLSIAQIGPGVFVYYSADGFFMGAEGRPIGRERVDRWFDSMIDRSLVHTIQAMVDPYQKIVWFQATSTAATKFLLGYQWALDRWCYADNNITMMAALVTPGVTIDGMDLFYATIDAATEPFDSRLFTGGSPTMAVFDTSNRLCYLTGTPRAATLETADQELSPGSRAFLQEARAYTNAADFTIKVGTSDYHGGAVTWGSAVTPYSSTRTCHFRSSARLHRFRMELASGAAWDHVIGLEPKFRTEGQR